MRKLQQMLQRTPDRGRGGRCRPGRRRKCLEERMKCALLCVRKDVSKMRGGAMRRAAYFLLLLSCGLWIAPQSFSQTTSTIAGSVRDKQGLAVAGEKVRAIRAALEIDRSATSGADGEYQITALPPGNYEIRAEKDGFQAEAFKAIELTLNRTLTFDITLQVGSVSQTVEVNSAIPLVDPTVSSTGRTITPRQIEDMPINGRNYLDLLQLVPGVALNRQADPSGDNATPILGERGGNTLYLIDGMPNRDNFNGGPSAQFNQDSIMEFQVVTGGYKAEFGHASGGVVNVVTRG